MKGLATLIKLHRRKLDELRRQMSSLENQKGQLQRLSAKLKLDLEKEIQMGSKQPEMGRFFGDYAKRMKKRQEDIAKEIKSLDKQMEDLGKKIAEQFSELKKFEIALENARLRAAEEARRQETIAMDEIAGQQHRRKLEEQ